LIIGQNILCQQQPYYLFFKQNMSLINPANTGIEGQLMALNFRTSMMGIENGPRTQSLIYHSKENKNAAWGISIQNEKINIESHGTVTFDFSYKLEITSNTKVNLGIKGGGFFNSVDVNLIERITPESNPSLDLIQNYWNPVVGVGVFLKGENYFFGLSTNNLLKSNRYEEKNGLVSQAIDKGQFYTSFGVDIKLTNTLSLSPSVMYSLVADIDNQLTAISHLNFNEKFSVGLGISNDYYSSLQFLFKGFKGLDIGIGYESRNSSSTKNSSIALNANNSEIFLRYKFNPNKSKKSSWYKEN